MKRIILTIIIFVLALFKGTAQEGAAKSALAEGDYQAAIKLYQVAIATCNNENKSADLYNSITNAQKCEELLGQANEAYKKKKYSEAKKLYQSILKYNPSDKFSKKRVSLCSNNTSQPKQEKSVQHEYVDLGLSVMWATCNIGASKPEDHGDHYAWGETKTKSEYSSSNSVTYEKNFNDIKGNAQYDAARANWGGTWRLPTRTELEELVNKCTWQWTTQGDEKGYKVTGPNGNSIFLPAAGYRDKSSLNKAGYYCMYWSSTPSIGRSFAYFLDLNSSYRTVTYNFRDRGRSVRPVCDKDANVNNTTSQQNKSNTSTQNTTKVSKPSNGTANGHEYVDLGLPSGLKWATCNVGATSPEDYGDYFAWGEIETKSSYTLYNSFARNERNLNGKNFGDIKGNAKYDAAAAKWGGNWRLPTKAELEELKNKCTWKWTTQGGKKGYKITGPNGNSIFLPAAGKRYNQSLHNINEGSYWSSTPRDENGVYAHLLSFGSSSNSKCVGSYEFVYGCSIRPVIK